MPDIEHLVRVAAPIASIHPLVSTADGFKQWWAEDVIAGPGDTVRLGFFDRATVYELAATDKSSALVIWRCQSGTEWQGTVIRFALSSSADGTSVRFAHAGWTERTEYFDLCTTTWGALMYRLKAAAEGRTQGPLFSATGVAY